MKSTNHECGRVVMTADTNVYDCPNGKRTGEVCKVGEDYGIQGVTCDEAWNVWGYLLSDAGWIKLSGRCK